MNRQKDEQTRLSECVRMSGAHQCVVKGPGVDSPLCRGGGGDWFIGGGGRGLLLFLDGQFDQLLITRHMHTYNGHVGEFLDSAILDTFIKVTSKLTGKMDSRANQRCVKFNISHWRRT